MRNPTGYARISDPDVGVQEWDTFTCAHCNRIVRVMVRASPAESGGWCGACARPVCLACALAGACTPFEERLEREEARGRLLRSILGS